MLIGQHSKKGCGFISIAQSWDNITYDCGKFSNWKKKVHTNPAWQQYSLKIFLMSKTLIQKGRSLTEVFIFQLTKLILMLWCMHSLIFLDNSGQVHSIHSSQVVEHSIQLLYIIMPLTIELNVIAILTPWL